jgi:hypothetical protein
VTSVSDRPIVPGFYPDPTICRVDGDYYLAHSSFEYFPGAPIFHSRDLLTWTQFGHILDRRSQFRRGDAQPSTGIYGSTLRHHAGRFWSATTNVSDFQSGQLVVHADDPAGPWSEPVFVKDALGIDPDLCWDDDDRCHLTWNALDLAAGTQAVRQATVDLTTGALGPAYDVWQGTGLAAPEGPHLYRMGDHWYLLLAEGGTERGHCVTVARAASPAGPFEPCPANPILTHRSTKHPVQNVGHADLVQTPDGQWAAVYLGTRPRGSTPGFHVLGRETFLAGVDWEDGWPVCVEDRFPAPATDTGFTDDFSSPALHHRWVVPGGEPELVADPHPAGELRLSGSGLLCTRVRDLGWTAEATFAAPGRFLLRIDDRHWYALAFQDGHVRTSARIGDIEHELGTIAVAGDTVIFRIAGVPPSSPPVPRGHAGPDEIVLSAGDAEGVHELARLDGRYLSTEVAGGFTGRMLALGPATGPARVLSVIYTPRDPGDRDAR